MRKRLKQRGDQKRVGALDHKFGIEQKRIERAVLDVLQLEISAGRGFSQIREVGVHYVSVSVKVMDGQSQFLRIALDLLNVPNIGDEDCPETRLQRITCLGKFPEIVTDGTRAQCRQYMRWVKAELRKSQTEPTL